MKNLNDIWDEANKLASEIFIVHKLEITGKLNTMENYSILMAGCLIASAILALQKDDPGAE